MSDARDPDRQLEWILAEHRRETAPDPGPDADAESFHPLDPFAPLPPVPAGSDDADRSAPADAADAALEDLPDAPLFALLRSVGDEVGVDRIDRIWVFPPRRLEIGETSVVVVAAFPEIDSDRRRVYAAHYTAQDEGRQLRLALAEYGTAPSERVGRLVEDVVERIKDGPAAPPRSHAIDGSHERWHAVLHELAGSYLDEAQSHPRLR
ncbi:MAG: hypothetical protein ACLFRX_04585 [Gemmatimonadota bacterium]